MNVIFKDNDNKKIIEEALERGKPSYIDLNEYDSMIKEGDSVMFFTYIEGKTPYTKTDTGIVNQIDYDDELKKNRYFITPDNMLLKSISRVGDEAWKYLNTHELKSLQEKYDELFNTVHDFMQNIDNYNVDIPTIMYDEWNEVNKLVGRD